MKKLIFLFGFLFFFFQALSQENHILQGIVLYQNSGRKPAEGITISTFSANGTITNSDGKFKLVYPLGHPGDLVKIYVYGPDKSGNQIEIVNTKELEAARIPSNPNEPLEIIICNAGERSKAALKYYNLLEASINQSYNQNIKLLENNSTTNDSNLERQIKLLKYEKDSALKKAEEQAQFIASINKDNSSNRIKEAIAIMDKGDGIDSAIKLLDEKQIDLDYEIGRKQKEKGEQIIKNTIIEYSLKISFANSKFKFNDVIECYKKLIAIYGQNNYPDIDKAVLYNGIAYAYLCNLDLYNFMAFNQKIIALSYTDTLIKHLFIPGIYNNIAVTSFLLQDYGMALTYGKIALQKALEVPSVPASAIATSYSNLGQFYYSLGYYDSSIVYDIKALDIYKKDNPRPLSDIATISYELGMSYQKKMDLKNAFSFDTIALNICQNYLPPKNPIIASTCNILADYYSVVKDYAKELKFAKKSVLNISEYTDPQTYSIFYETLGNAYKSSGYLDSALDCYQNAVNMLEMYRIPNNFLLGSCFASMGDINKKKVKNLTSLSFFEKSLILHEKSQPQNHFEIAVICINIAQLYGSLGYYGKGVKYCDTANSIIEKNRLDSLDIKTIAFVVTSQTYQPIGEYDKALIYINKAIDLTESAGNNQNWELAYFYYIKARLWLSKKSEINAKECTQKIINLSDTAHYTNQLDLASTYKNLALAYCLEKKYFLAINYYSVAYRIDSTVNYTSYYSLVGHFFAKNGQMNEAFQAFTNETNGNRDTSSTYYDWSFFYALKNDKEQSIAFLRKAIKYGFANLDWLNTEDGFKTLRRDSRFKAIITEIKEKQKI